MESIKTLIVSLGIIGSVSFGIKYLIMSNKLIKNETTAWLVSIYLAYLLMTVLILKMLKDWISSSQIEIPANVIKAINASTWFLILVIPVYYTLIIGITRYFVDWVLPKQTENMKFMIAILVVISFSVFLMPAQNQVRNCDVVQNEDGNVYLQCE